MSLMNDVALKYCRQNPWSWVYGLARSILALSLLMTLFLNPLGSLFPLDSTGTPLLASNPNVSNWNYFCLFGPAHLEWARWIAVLALAWIASGHVPRFTGVLHWWLAFSFFSSASVTDGGDQLNSILTLLLLPLTLTDPRNFHWEPVHTNVGLSRRLTGWFAFLLLRLQMAVVYFHAAVGKFKVPEWTDGSAIYYWASDPIFGFSDLTSFLAPFTLNKYVIGGLTWGTLVLEITLASALISKAAIRWPLLVFGLIFHSGIWVVHGIPSFVMIMYAGLILYLVPVDARVPQIFDLQFPRRLIEVLSFKKWTEGNGVSKLGL